MVSRGVIELTNKGTKWLSALCDEFQVSRHSGRAGPFKGTPAHQLTLLGNGFRRLKLRVSAMRFSADIRTTTTQQQALKHDAYASERHNCEAAVQRETMRGKMDSLQSRQS
jgi:hypothetical protein